MSFGITPPTQPVADIDLNGFVIGITRIILDGSWLGSVKEGTGASLVLNPNDKYIMSGHYPGTRLGKRQLGESPEIKFSNVEGSLANIQKFLDLRNTVGAPGTLALGRRNNVQSYHTADLYGEAPGQRTRLLHLYRVGIRLDGDINLFDPEDFTTFPLAIEIYPDMTLQEDTWYGLFTDTPPV